MPTLLGFLTKGFIWDIPILVLLMCFYITTQHQPLNASILQPQSTLQLVFRLAGLAVACRRAPAPQQGRQAVECLSGLQAPQKLSLLKFCI